MIGRPLSIQQPWRAPSESFNNTAEKTIDFLSAVVGGQRLWNQLGELRY